MYWTTITHQTNLMFPLLIYRTFLKGYKVIAELLLAFHINYINGAVGAVEMETIFPEVA